MRSGRTFDVARDRALAPLADADRRLAHEIAAGVLRQRAVLDAGLSSRVSGRWDTTPEDLRDILRIAAYQLSALDRVPAYAAVSDAVTLARHVRGAKSAAFVNAVLRNLTRDTTPPAAAEGQPDDAAALAARYSHPEWLVVRWLQRFGPERTTALLAHDNARPAVVIQPARWSAEQLVAALAGAGVAVEPHPFGGLVVHGKVTQLPGFAEGAFVVQDPAQARLLQFAAVPEGATVWDACAAPGGKAAVLARTCRVLATDRGRPRVTRLAETVQRAAPTVRVIRADARRAPFRAATFDAVLVDAPCSATGTLARHPDARWRLSPERIADVARLQAELLAAVADYVRPGGVLLYLTCSLEPEENAEQVGALLQARPDFSRTAADCNVFPPDAGTDGGYAARLRRAA